MLWLSQEEATKRRRQESLMNPEWTWSEELLDMDTPQLDEEDIHLWTPQAAPDGKTEWWWGE